MKRRDAVAALLAVGASPRAAFAQQPGRIYRVGVLFSGGSATMQPHRDAVREQLAKEGFVEGRNLQMTWRGGSDIWHDDRETAHDLVAGRPDAILAFSARMTRAVQAETNSIPVVFAHVSDPIADGIANNYARPGGNTTGISTHHRELLGKRFELLRELLPEARRVALVTPWATDPSFSAAEPTIVEVAARLHFEVIEVLYSQLSAIAEKRAEAMIVYNVLGQRLMTENLIETALRLRIPSIFPDAESVVLGGLASYGTDPLEDTRLAAELLGRVLTGAKAGNQPVYRNSRFVLALNLKTAKALDLGIPQSLLARADRVIG